MSALQPSLSQIWTQASGSPWRFRVWGRSLPRYVKDLSPLKLGSHAPTGGPRDFSTTNQPARAWALPESRFGVRAGSYHSPFTVRAPTLSTSAGRDADQIPFAESDR